MLCNVDINRILHQSQISALSTLGSMLSFTGLSLAGGLRTKLSSEVHSWRLILGDGNCYYRAFMFAMIENFILNKDLYSIRKLLFDVNNIIDAQFSKKNVVIDKSEINIAFYLILDYLENGSIQEAYDVFIKSYYFYKTFDYGLIKYMRIALYKYSDANKNKIYSAESQVEIGNLLPSAYIEKGGYNFKAFFEEYLLLCMHNEAEKIIIYLSPIVFNINLDLYIIEGTAQLQKENIKYFKQSINCLKNGQNAKISLLYRFNHYDCLYSHLMFEKNFRNITYQADGYRKSRFEVFIECQCELCGQQSELIVFHHIPNNPLCKNCLFITLTRIMIIRIKAYISEFYINKECIYIFILDYCRPVTLESNNNYCLYDEDFVALTGKTISQQFLYLLENCCPDCNNYFEPQNSSQLIKLKCECKICEKCLKLKINKCTNDKVILNVYEQSK
jgi:hypothetical protein